MSIQDSHDWGHVERLAQNHEAHFLPVAPVPPPTIEQQLAWATTELAQAKARLRRKDSTLSTSIMWLSVGESNRAMEALNKGLLDL